MAATKKTPAKKTATKAVAKKRPATKTTKKAVKKTTKLAVIQGSFTIQADKQPFMSFRLTDQTLYWSIFAVTIFVLGLWVLKLHLAVEEIYDQIDRNTAISETYIPVADKKMPEVE